MKVSQRTLQILKNFATINQSLLFKPGNIVSTISPMKTVLAKATVAEEFDREFAIYDMPRFLGVLSLFVEPDLQTGATSVAIKDTNQKVNYTYAEPSMIVTPPDKEIKLGDIVIEFKLTADNLARVLKAMSVLQTPELAVVGNGETITIETLNTKNPSSDSFSIAVGETEYSFKMVFREDNLRLIAGDYDVQISRKGTAHFVGKDVEYWVQTEHSSTFSE